MPLWPWPAVRISPLDARARRGHGRLNVAPAPHHKHASAARTWPIPEWHDRDLTIPPQQGCAPLRRGLSQSVVTSTSTHIDGLAIAGSTSLLVGSSL